MIWYMSKDKKRLSNLSKALGFQAVSIGETRTAIEEVYESNDGIRGIYIESFDDGKGGEKAERFIDWLGIIILDKRDSCTYDYKDFSNLIEKCEERYMTDTDEFISKGHEASFFNDLIKRVSLEAEKQYSEYAKNAKPCFSNAPYWQMSTDVPVMKMERLVDSLMDMIYEEEKDTYAEALQSIRDCKKKSEEIMVQALLAYICVGTYESDLIIQAEMEGNECTKKNTKS